MANNSSKKMPMPPSMQRLMSGNITKDVDKLPPPFQRAAIDYRANKNKKTYTSSGR